MQGDMVNINLEGEKVKILTKLYPKYTVNTQRRKNQNIPSMQIKNDDIRYTTDLYNIMEKTYNKACRIGGLELTTKIGVLQIKLSTISNLVGTKNMTSNKVYLKYITTIE